jgi:hypothetical protein
VVVRGGESGSGRGRPVPDAGRAGDIGVGVPSEPDEALEIDTSQAEVTEPVVVERFELTDRLLHSSLGVHIERTGDRRVR